VTMARGIPFTWTRWNGLNPRIMVPGDTKPTDIHGNAIPRANSFSTSAFAFSYQGREFGIYLPDNTTVKWSGDYLEPQLSGANNYMVIGYLPDASGLA